MKANLENKTKTFVEIVYFDMDGVLVDFMSGVSKYPKKTQELYKDNLDEIPNVFSQMNPYPDMVQFAKDMYNDKRYDVYILSSPSSDNPSSWTDKFNWVQKHLPMFKRRLILSHNKNLNIGDYLIDDRTKNGAGEFTGEHIYYGTNKYIDVNSLRKKFNL
jgi:5'-nucleotidase|tara:strand:+ start:120 stop:599 length:480 start_codon:yes stop_codon:yes gene_type:complete